jgi:hypothetical protein
MRFTRREFVVKMGVLPMGINQLQRRDEVNSPSQVNFCLEAHYRMREDGVQALRAEVKTTTPAQWRAIIVIFSVSFGGRCFIFPSYRAWLEH